MRAVARSRGGEMHARCAMAAHRRERPSSAARLPAARRARSRSAAAIAASVPASTRIAREQRAQRVVLDAMHVRPRCRDTPARCRAAAASALQRCRSRVAAEHAGRAMTRTMPRRSRRGERRRSRRPIRLRAARSVARARCRDWRCRCRRAAVAQRSSATRNSVSPSTWNVRRDRSSREPAARCRRRRSASSSR